jgi:hypothetical protein
VLIMEIAWFTMENEFMHARVMSSAEKLDKKDLLEIFSMVHKQYQLNKRLFSQLLKHCASAGVELPPLNELLEPSTLGHPEANK